MSLIIIRVALYKTMETQKDCDLVSHHQFNDMITNGSLLPNSPEDTRE